MEITKDLKVRIVGVGKVGMSIGQAYAHKRGRGRWSGWIRTSFRYQCSRFQVFQ